MSGQNSQIMVPIAKFDRSTRRNGRNRRHSEHVSQPLDGSDDGLPFSTGIEWLMIAIGGWHEAETLQRIAAMATNIASLQGFETIRPVILEGSKRLAGGRGAHHRIR